MESRAELQLGPIGQKREGERKEAMGLKREGGFSFFLLFYSHFKTFQKQNFNSF